MRNMEQSTPKRRRPGRLRLGLAAVALFGLPPVSDYSYPVAEYSSVPLHQQAKIELFTANVHNRPLIHFLNEDFLEANPAGILEAVSPDVAFFQEISSRDARELPAHGYNVAYEPNSEIPLNESTGIAVASTRKMSKVEIVDLSEISNRPAIVADIDGFKFAGVHLSNDQRLAMEELKRLVELHPDLDGLGGDFNLKPSKVSHLIGDFAVSSTDKPTLPRPRKRSADRILFGKAEFNLAEMDGQRLSTFTNTAPIGSDHLGVYLELRPQNEINTPRSSFN